MEESSGTTSSQSSSNETLNLNTDFSGNESENTQVQTEPCSDQSPKSVELPTVETSQSQSQTEKSIHQSSESGSNEPSDGKTEKIEVITIPFETKADLQMKLLREQIEYTKRDIYLKELVIFGKEEELALSEGIKKRILEQSETIFAKRMKY